MKLSDHSILYHGAFPHYREMAMSLKNNLNGEFKSCAMQVKNIGEKKGM